MPYDPSIAVPPPTPGKAGMALVPHNDGNTVDLVWLNADGTQDGGPALSIVGSLQDGGHYISRFLNPGPQFAKDSSARVLMPNE